MIYTFPRYVPGSVFAIAVIAVAIGALLLWKRKPPGLAWVAIAVGALAGGVFAPGMAMDRVVLDEEKLEQTTGFWFSPTVKGFRLADVESITINIARDRKDREYEVWEARLKNGRLQRIDPGDLWEMNGPDIIERLKAKGVEVR